MTNSQENRLINESSPYLRQHARNPVDWFPWGQEALELAKEEGRPIFLSIGYSACHWCHVMERESFENTEIAAILNKHFICIKVDREERPDLDNIYMAAVQALTGQGGWPMSVFLTPELKPFFGGTYFPPTDRYGRPGFPRLLLTIADWWINKRKEIGEQADQITHRIQMDFTRNPQQTPLNEAVLKNAGNELAKSFDKIHGGFGGAPKFPRPMDIRLLFRLFHRFEESQFLHMAIHSLEKMAQGGIYDHVGGGFARYSTDSHWFAPHFEKMLYDNAQLLNCYLEGYQITGNIDFLEVVQDTITWAEREMLSTEGLFFSTLDADSEGEEGKFYVWEKPVITSIINRDFAEKFCSIYGIDEGGNWEGKNILFRKLSWEAQSQLEKVDRNTLQNQCKMALNQLFHSRQSRVRPGLDDKCLASWNGLMLDGLAKVSMVTGLDKHIALAEKCAKGILLHLKNPKTGRLWRTWTPNSHGKIDAFLEDYSFCILGFISLFEATGHGPWLAEALNLTDMMIQEFHDPVDQGFFYTANSQDPLIHRPKEWQDNAIPSGNSIAVECLLKLGTLTNRKEYLDLAWNCLTAFSPLLAKFPQAMGQMLCSLDFALGPVSEWVWSSNYPNEEIKILIQRGNKLFRPNQISLRVDQDNFSQIRILLPWLIGMEPKDSPRWFQCQGGACLNPIEGIEIIEKRLLQLTAPK